MTTFYHATDTDPNLILDGLDGDQVPDHYLENDDCPFDEDSEVIYIGRSPRDVACYGKHIIEIEVTSTDAAYIVADGEYIVSTDDIISVKLSEEIGKESKRDAWGIH